MNSQDFHSGILAPGVQAHVNPKSYLTLRFRIVIEQDEDGVFVAECPNLPGCLSQGKTRDEAPANIRDAIEGYLASLQKHGESIPPLAGEEIVESISNKLIWSSKIDSVRSCSSQLRRTVGSQFPFTSNLLWARSGRSFGKQG